MTTSGNPKLSAYQKTALDAKVAGASPHELVRLLFAKLCEKLQEANDNILLIKEKKENKSEIIVKNSQLFLQSSNIIAALQGSLKKEPNEKLYDALNFLYAHTQYYIAEANQNADEKAVEQALKVAKDLLSIWESIPAEYHQMTSR